MSQYEYICGYKLFKVGHKMKEGHGMLSDSSRPEFHENSIITSIGCKINLTKLGDVNNW